MVAWIVALALLVAVVVPAAGAADDGAPRARFAGDRLSVAATAQPWSAVLATLARDARVRVHGAPAGDALVTIALVDLPLEHALARLFGRSTSFAIRYAASPADETEVWIVGPQARPARATPPVVVAHDAGESLARLDAPEPAVRRAVVESLDAREPAVVRELARVIRHDPDADVRAAAAAALARHASDDAIGAVGFALSDPHASVRIRAIEALTERGGEAAAHVLRTALDDRDRAVRTTAAAALPGLTGTVR